jgi:hypothetical protein
MWLFGLLGVGTLLKEALLPTAPHQGLAGFFWAPSFATALLLFLFTSGPYRRLGEYRSLHEAAKRVCAEADRLLHAPDRLSETDALLLAGAYHLARKGSPLLPGFIWRLRRGKLNRLWNDVAQEGAQKE